MDTLNEPGALAKARPAKTLRTDRKEEVLRCDTTSSSVMSRGGRDQPDSAKPRTKTEAKMRYISTRGGMAAKRFLDILLGGLASDGGLAVPKAYPVVTSEELLAWRDLSYSDLAFAIISRFADDIPPKDLRTLINRSYTSDVFGSSTITPLKTLEPGLHILALSNGPTLAFKDIAMQLLGHLFEYALSKNRSELNILGATSGDTGSSAEYAMRGKKGIRVFMLSPYLKMSPFQTAQMFSLQDPNIFNVAIRGVFDECQDIVKAVSTDTTFKSRCKIGTVNSINWARVAAQVVYYFKGYFAATKSNDQRVSFAVPSGNFGNVCAGHIARMMGLPIKHLIVANNENDVLNEFFRTGLYRVRPAHQVVQTSSPSMDISKASNFERIIFDVVDRDPNVIRDLWRKVENDNVFDLSDTPYFDRLAEFGFVSGKSTHRDRMRTIKDVHDRYEVLVDTHTADGIKVGLEYREADVPLICLETAQPAKFANAIVEAVGFEPKLPKGLQNLELQPQRFVVMDADDTAVKDYISSHVA